MSVTEFIPIDFIKKVSTISSIPSVPVLYFRKEKLIDIQKLHFPQGNEKITPKCDMSLFQRASIVLLFGKLCSSGV